jgi:hypothetical protein
MQWVISQSRPSIQICFWPKNLNPTMYNGGDVIKQVVLFLVGDDEWVDAGGFIGPLSVFLHPF